jgi:acyl-CoA thioesterase FadM
MRVEDDDRLVADGWGTLVRYDYESGRAQPIPDDFRRLIEPTLVG